MPFPSAGVGSSKDSERFVGRPNPGCGFVLALSPAGICRWEPMIKHLDYDEPVLGYHQVLADLAAELAADGAAVADIGCGPGQILGRLSARRPDLRLTGIDGDAECLERAEVRCPNARFIKADIEHLATDVPAGDRYQVLISSHALEHLADPVRALKQWQQLLSPGGKIVLAVPNSLQPLVMARAIARRPKVNEGHYFIWDRATFENFCRLAGFRIVDRALDYVPLVPVRIRNRIPAIASVERSLLGPLPEFSNSHIVTLEPAYN